ncbi:hypothetical protein QFZ58_000640 [Streptomyces sp. B1I3]|nr:hypothetical protein [Streptomyces sp. B1I3]
MNGGRYARTGGGPNRADPGTEGPVPGAEKPVPGTGGRVQGTRNPVPGTERRGTCRAGVREALEVLALRAVLTVYWGTVSLLARRRRTPQAEVGESVHRKR